MSSAIFRGGAAMDRELRILLDERAINAVMNEYCHAMDSGEHDRWMNCFTADAVYDVALPDGRIYARLEGEAEFRRFITNYQVLPGHKHVYVTPIFDVEDRGHIDVLVTRQNLVVGDEAAELSLAFQPGIDAPVGQGDIIDRVGGKAVHPAVMLTTVHRVAIFVHHSVDGALIEQNTQLTIHGRPSPENRRRHGPLARSAA